MMLIAIVTSIVLITVIDRFARVGRIELAEARTRHELFALRDRLRREAIAGAIQFDGWFKYMDTTLTRSIDSVHDVNLWKALTYFSVYGRLEMAERAYSDLQEAMQQRPALRAVYTAYSETLWDLIEERHILIRNLPKVVFAAGRVFSALDGCFSWLRKSKRHALEGLLSAPETSTLLEYAPIHRH
jgi:hypothetical protein